MRRMTRNGVQRTLAALAVAGCFAATHLPAGAAPSTVGTAHDDTGSFVIRGTDGLSYDFTVEVKSTQSETGSGGGATATITYKGCKKNGKCGFTYSYGLALPASAYGFPDKNSATLTTTLLGKPLHVTWTSSGQNNYNGVIDNDDAYFSDPTSGGVGTVTVQIFGIKCAGGGNVENYYGAFANPAGARTTGPSKVPAAFIATKKAKPACQSG